MQSLQRTRSAVPCAVVSDHIRLAPAASKFGPDTSGCFLQLTVHTVNQALALLDERGCPARDLLAGPAHLTWAGNTEAPPPPVTPHLPPTPGRHIDRPGQRRSQTATSAKP